MTRLSLAGRLEEKRPRNFENLKPLDSANNIIKKLGQIHKTKRGLLKPSFWFYSQIPQQIYPKTNSHGNNFTQNPPT
ncbi:hypothetical protein AD948_13675 [Acetobacter senegalensis]|uniref:Uncharacterized protein n=1 Tax=Acetobacter senegalensis TaxID=446692 RepID=A0A149TWN7_9PROT|nr:hypothetical protein [Acetobacter senegalensis]KXV57571.1 hypothetical protein AD948_13675 [Acetobacter senegalensis]